MNRPDSRSPWVTKGPHSQQAGWAGWAWSCGRSKNPRLPRYPRALVESGDQIPSGFKGVNFMLKTCAEKMCWKNVLKRKGTGNSELIERAALWLCILWSKEGVSHGSAWAWDRLDVLRMLRHVEPQLLGWFMMIWCRRCVHKLFIHVLDHLIPVFGGTEQDPVTSCRSLHRRWMSAPVLQRANWTTTSIGWLDGVWRVWRTFTYIQYSYTWNDLFLHHYFGKMNDF